MSIPRVPPPQTEAPPPSPLSAALLYWSWWWNLLACVGAVGLVLVVLAAVGALVGQEWMMLLYVLGVALTLATWALISRTVALALCWMASRT